MVLVDLSGPLGARDRRKAAGTTLVRGWDESLSYLAENDRNNTGLLPAPKVKVRRSNGGVRADARQLQGKLGKLVE